MYPSILLLSQFIQRATGQDNGTVNHSWKSSEAEIRAVKTTHPTAGYPVVFVDTPGFDSTFNSDIEILAVIADWLVKT